MSVQAETPTTLYLECATHGTYLSGVDMGGRITVDPCPACLTESRQEGYEEGHREGFAECAHAMER